MEKSAGNIIEKRYVAVAALLVLFAMALQQLVYCGVAVDVFNLFCSLVRSVLYVGLIIAWGVSIRRRVLHSAVRRYLLGIAWLLLLWFLLRTCKYLFLEGMVQLQYYCWYGYYIPICLIPLLGIFLAASLGKPESYVIPTPVRLLLVPTAVLVLLVLTNHTHQLMFAFPQGMDDADGVYTHELVYSICLIWMGLEVLTFLLLLLWNSHVPGKKKRIWLPVIPVGVAILYTVGYLLHVELVYRFAGDMTAVFTLVTLAICESCIRTGLIPSNSRYDELFQASTIGAQIVDEDYGRCFASDTAIVFPVELMRRTDGGSVDLGSQRLSGARIQGGHVLWVEDVSQVKELLQRLEQTSSRLEENNNLLRAEVELKEKQAQAEEQVHLYDKITQGVAPQLEKLEALLQQGGDLTGTKRNLAHVCVISSYIKRRGNLLLLTEEVSFLPARELEYCLRESMENLRCCGAASFLGCRCEGILSKESSLAAYTFFEDVVECTLASLTAILVNLTVSEESVQMVFSLSCDKETLLSEPDFLQSSPGEVELSEEDDDLHLVFRLSKGGGRS